MKHLGDGPRKEKTTGFICGPSEAEKKCAHEFDGEGVMLRDSEGKESGWTAVCKKCAITAVDAVLWQDEV